MTEDELIDLYELARKNGVSQHNAEEFVAACTKHTFEAAEHKLERMLPALKMLELPSVFKETV